MAYVDGFIVPVPQKNLADYVAQSAPKKSDPNSWNLRGLNYRNFTVRLLKSCDRDGSNKDNECAFG